MRVGKKYIKINEKLFAFYRELRYQADSSERAGHMAN
jgi:hypothetical protein